MQILKVGVYDMVFKPFAPWGKALGFEFPPDLGIALPGVGFMA